MTTVFDIINELREAKKMTIRGLGEMAEIKPTTFESMMARRPRSIDIERLDKIARVFGLCWDDLFEYGREAHGIGTEHPKVDTYIKDEEKSRIVERAFTLAGMEALIPTYVYKRPEKDKASQFRETLHTLIDSLNEDGVMEAMWKLSEIGRNPIYRKENKENTGV